MSKRTKTSKAWLHEHVTDPFVKAAKKEGYRSRAAYKLLEIDKRDVLFKPGMLVVDLGAAPGSWSQVAKKRIGTKGRIIAMDLLPMESISGVNFFQADFAGEEGLKALINCCDNAQIDIVISDMAPNISGIGLADQARSMELAELAADFALKHLKFDGDFLVKLFQGTGFEEFVRFANQNFAKIVIRKPEASRDRSNEVYLLARGKKILNSLS